MPACSGCLSPGLQHVGGNRMGTVVSPSKQQDYHGRVTALMHNENKKHQPPKTSSVTKKGVWGKDGGGVTTAKEIFRVLGRERIAWESEPITEQSGWGMGRLGGDVPDTLESGSINREQDFSTPLPSGSYAEKAFGDNYEEEQTCLT
ncbi:hypothetical protein FQA47_013122 [Oryzias melastigma]|uniref:Uncharacterized protein n=1 Tax=Oryzias melastigma TaxID=30732 RepID=A0A834BZL0_ORYME|nr:hypothetical protein FQA47_013122 [Oryzias melastigma]